MDLVERFRSAGADGLEFRGAPFWSWNDDLEPEEIRRQIREMKAAGLGGAFMHARVGLITPYMGSRWMDCIASAIDESERCGFWAWLYDEDKWPSGTAGGAVVARLGLEKAAARRLECQEVAPQDLERSPDTIATFAAKRAGQTIVETQRFDGEPPECDVVLRFSAPPRGYVDLMSRDVVAEFVEVAYEAYRQKFGDKFGGVVPGIFTDEPNYLTPPWSLELPAYFRSRFGYELVDHLPKLFYRLKDHAKVRHDYFMAATELYVDSFSRQIGEWCGKHNLLFTGHQLMEDNLLSQTERIGAAMPHYVHMQMPGIDHLCRQLGTVALVNQCSSVAHQFGGRRVLSEMFGCCGWNVSLEELKWIGDYQIALGVDFICQHLSLYSMRGCRKRDYPPSLHYQQPYWPDGYRLLNDRFARLLAALTWGKFQADLLVIHPIASAWAVWDPQDKSEGQQLSREFEQLSRTLVEIQREFDYGDEMIMAQHARVEGPEIVIGDMRYSAVLLPRMVTIASTTLQLLQRLLANGGRVLLVSEPPPLMDGSPSDEPARMLADCPVCDPRPEALADALDRVLPERIEARAAGFGRAVPLCHQHRAEGDMHVFFFMNMSREQAVDADIVLPVAGRPYEMRTETGEVEPLAASPCSGGTQIRLSFPPMGAHLIMLNAAEMPQATLTFRPPSRKTLATLSGPWRVERLEPNALTLDSCRWRIDDDDWQGPEPVIRVSEMLGRREGAFDVSLRFDFDSQVGGDAGAFELICETPERFAIRVNGNAVLSKDSGWWRDIAFRRIPVAQHVREGHNEIELRTHFAELPKSPGPLADEQAIYQYNLARYSRELESIYLIGNFDVVFDEEAEPAQRRALWVKGPFRIAASSSESDGVDLTSEGLPFFAGRVRLSQTLRLDKAPEGQVLLQLARPDAIVAAVTVNGQPAGRIAWAPYEVDISGLLKDGENEVAIELAGSCRNLLGPHHHRDGELYGVGPGQFLAQRRSWLDRPGEGSLWRDEYCLVQFGLGGRVTVVSETREGG